MLIVIATIPVIKGCSVTPISHITGMSSKAFKLLLLFLIWVVYITIGVFIFKAVEGNDDINTEKTDPELLEKLKRSITTTFNMSESDFDNIVQQIEAASSSNSGPKWTYSNTLSFIIQLLTTIGKLSGKLCLSISAALSLCSCCIRGILDRQFATLHLEY